MPFVSKLNLLSASTLNYTTLHRTSKNNQLSYARDTKHLKEVNCFRRFALIDYVAISKQSKSIK